MALSKNDTLEIEPGPSQDKKHRARDDMTASVFVVVNATLMACRKKTMDFGRFFDLAAVFSLEMAINLFLNLVPSQGLKKDAGRSYLEYAVAAATVMAFARKNQRFLAGFPIWRYLA